MNTAMWTAATRAQHMRDGLRFDSDLTDAEWAVLEPLLPPASATGRPPAWPLRELVNAMFYVLRGGIPWRMLPPCFPPRQTVYGWFAVWRDAGVGRRSIIDWSWLTASVLGVKPAVPSRFVWNCLIG